MAGRLWTVQERILGWDLDFGISNYMIQEVCYTELSEFHS